MNNPSTSSGSSASSPAPYAKGAARSLLQRADALLKTIEAMRAEVQSWKTTLGHWCQSVKEGPGEGELADIIGPDHDEAMKVAESKVKEASKATAYEQLAAVQLPASTSKGHVGPAGQKGGQK